MSGFTFGMCNHTLGISWCHLAIYKPACSVNAKWQVLHNVVQFITPARAARSAARRAYNHRVPTLRARARQPRFGSSMQYCIRSLISITNVQKYCKGAKVCASQLLWHFKTIWIENICLLFIEVHCSNQQKLFHFAHRGFSYFLISTPKFQ